MTDLTIPPFLDRRRPAAGLQRATGGSPSEPSLPAVPQQPVASGPLLISAKEDEPPTSLNPSEKDDQMAKKMRADTEFQDDVTGETGLEGDEGGGRRRRKAKKVRSGSYDPQRIRVYADRLHSLTDDMESAAGGFRADIKALLDEIADAGIPKKTFKLVFGEERRARKLKEKVQNLDIDERSSFEMLKDALGTFGETPLGTAALSAVQQTAAASAPAGNA